jgi:hypothetical protein
VALSISINQNLGVCSNTEMDDLSTGQDDTRSRKVLMNAEETRVLISEAGKSEVTCQENLHPATAESDKKQTTDMSDLERLARSS